MHHSPQIFNLQGESGAGTQSLSKVGGPEHQTFETIGLPFNIMSPLQTSTALCGTRAWTSFHQHDPQIDVPSSFCSELPQEIYSPLPCHKSSGDNSAVTAKQYPSASQFSFTNSLHSIVESFLSSSEESFSSSDMYGECPSDSDRYREFLGEDNMSLHERSKENELRAEDAAEEVEPVEISFQHRNLQSPDKQCSRACGVACVPSPINTVSRSSLTRKRRIRWTKDLHETFVMIVNCLGGPEKAKPKSILKMMDSDMLTISHIKSHLQKYRSTICVRKDLQERSGEGNQPEGVFELQLKIHKQIEESLQLQREVQRSLHEQLEIQQNLQLLVKQQRKQLKITSDYQKQGSKLQVCAPK
ncbi:myb family transcription factor PHL13-like [Neltuma alba]|uniref:myb family transcription factor PHL13-like n=1 Tax=Neltuma alba TaxID=207710 RepID=UPI0010A4382F|nr:myb family transcription factor PHL13-like [Prosopis alba]